MNKDKYFLFLFGIFISSLGSNAFVLTVANILKDHGMALWFLGLFVALNRFTVFLTQTLFGHLGDQISPLKMVSFSEIGAAISTIFLLLNVDSSGFFIKNNAYFVIFGILRIFFVSLQASSIQKISKNFDLNLKYNGKASIHLSLVSNLALCIMGVLTFLYFKEINLKHVLIFDACTFIFNGLFIFIIPQLKTQKQHKKIKIQFNLTEYYKIHPKLFYKDLYLCIALFGANILNFKLLSNYINWIPILTMIFGLSGVIASSSYFASHKYHEKNIFWITLGLSVIFQGMFANQPYVMVVLAFIRNFTYWLILNSIAKEFMLKTDMHNYATLSSSRQGINVGILSIGEIVTANFNLLNIKFENMIRGIGAFIPIYINLNNGKKHD
ncbi:MAG: MFS transporter [Pseudobdellovibrio sp.]